MNNYNFETRQLFPFCDKWENGMQGELWYVWEEDAICIVNGDERQPIAKGYGAALLANKNVLYSWGFNPIDFYKAYNYELEKANFPGRYPFQETRRILYDWFFTLQQLEPIKNDFSDYLDYAQRIQVGIIMRDYYNPYKIVDIKKKLEWRSHMICDIAGHKELQLIFATRPELEDLSATPTIWIKAMDAKYNTSKAQVYGFMAALINYAIYSYWVEHWQTYNFANPAFLELFIESWEHREPIKEKANLAELQFLTDVSILDFCQAYMDTFAEITRQVWERTPTIPIECWDGDNFYSYMYACECESRTEFLKSELYQNLTPTQQKMIYGYSLRFTEFLAKRYPVSAHAQHEIMKALARDMPPIQLEITNNTEITRIGYPIPEENNYLDVIRWLEQEKIDGHDHFEEAGRNRTKMCKNLSDIFGWYVDQNSLQKAQNRIQKK